MDNTNLILTDPTFLPSPLELDARYQILDTRRESSIEYRESREQIAKDFESVLVNKLLDEMRKTVGNWGFDKDGACEQVQGIFWLYLARDIANNGGFGLWKDIYKSIQSTTDTHQDASLKNILGDDAQPTTESLNENI